MHLSKALQFPCIHANGTSANRLQEDLGNAYYAIDQAYDKLRECAPNGRDYYTLGPAAFEKAIAEHHARLAKLDEVKAELEAIMEEINAQTGN